MNINRNQKISANKLLFLQIPFFAVFILLAIVGGIEGEKSSEFYDVLVTITSILLIINFFAVVISIIRQLFKVSKKTEQDAEDKSKQQTNSKIPEPCSYDNHSNHTWSAPKAGKTRKCKKCRGEIHETDYFCPWCGDK